MPNVISQYIVATTKKKGRPNTAAPEDGTASCLPPHHRLIDPVGGVKKHRFLMALNELDLRNIDAVARNMGVSRAEGIRRLLAEAIATGRYAITPESPEPDIPVTGWTPPKRKAKK
jgi:hypothetical protein